VSDEPSSVSPDVSLLVVGYRSTADLPALTEGFRAEVTRAKVTGEIVVVEHSGESAPPAGVEVDRWIVQPNHGYAAGINRAAAEARGRVLLAANPDLRLLPGALSALLGALADGWHIVGPRFELQGALFPPAESQLPSAELRRSLAARGAHPFHRSLSRRLREAARVWDGREPVPQRFLSGALLAFAPATFRELGPWDEEYFLYFEETDWLLRAARRGCRVAQVPAARVEHRWGGGGGSDAEPEERYAASRARYYRRSFGWWGALALRLSRDAAPLRVEEPRATGVRWWLASPSPAGWPAARLALRPGEEPEAAASRLAAALGRDTTLTLWSWDPARRTVGEVRGAVGCRGDG
jgi:GT2 family glycosyltransferase